MFIGSHWDISTKQIDVDTVLAELRHLTRIHKREEKKKSRSDAKPLAISCNISIEFSGPQKGFELLHIFSLFTGVWHV